MTFLDIVAKDILEKYSGNLSQVTIVFPNKRASLFFSKALTEHWNKPLWSPRYATISELFSSQSDLEPGDHIMLVLELYKVYREITGSQETIDQFYNWGELMLADFDDVDKHLADASKVFTLVSDMHELDNVDYLSDEQQKVLHQFFSNFTSDHTSVLKKRFIMLWNKFHDIYTTYRERLLQQGIAYEGMMYRRVIENHMLPQAGGETYIFIGFNLLNEVEHKLFLHYKAEGAARFYWDFDAYYMPKKGEKMSHEAGRYINEHLRMFPNELDYDHETYHRFGEHTEVCYISSPTDDLQARYIAQWLTPERIAAGRKTAIVLADESLLETVLHCLPPTVTHVNVTTGFPLSQAPVASFVRILMATLQKRSPTLHSVNALLRHPYIKYISGQAMQLHDSLNEAKIYYPTLEDLAIDENLGRLFAPLSGGDDCMELTDRMIWAVTTIARNIRAENDDFANEGLYRMFTILNRMSNLLQPSGLESLSEVLYTRLLQQIIQSTTIPFHGEPIEGIQIMGVLETRNLDFDNVLLLSCNEGNLPAKINDSSFIPHSIRRAYELTTVENKVAIYSYYFHRLIQRAANATILYNNATTDGRTGEMSRFMLQLLAESPLHIKQKNLVAGQATSTVAPKEITKTEEMVDILLAKGSFSPSALGKYLRCPLSFYHCYIEGLYENDDSDEDEIDSRIFGNIFHRAAELLYSDHKQRTITKNFLDSLLEEKGNVTLQRIVDQAIREKLFNISDDKRATPKLGGLQVVNREMILHFMKQLVSYDAQHAPFIILGLEERHTQGITIDTAHGTHTIEVGGIIDRLDCKEEADGMHIRVLDYKTGRPPLRINMPAVEDIFNPEEIRNHSDYYLQALLYSGIIGDQYNAPVSPALLYIQKTSAENYSPTLKIDNQEILDARLYSTDFRHYLKLLIEDILDTAKPFMLPASTDRCAQCPYHGLCYSKEADK